MTELSLPVVVVFTEKVRHDVGAGVASVVQARKAKAASTDFSKEKCV